jgi:hypothetical protein
VEHAPRNGPRKNRIAAEHSLGGYPELYETSYFFRRLSRAAQQKQSLSLGRGTGLDIAQPGLSELADWVQLDSRSSVSVLSVHVARSVHEGKIVVESNFPLSELERCRLRVIGHLGVKRSPQGLQTLCPCCREENAACLSRAIGQRTDVCVMRDVGGQNELTKLHTVSLVDRRSESIRAACSSAVPANG